MAKMYRPQILRVKFDRPSKTNETEIVALVDALAACMQSLGYDLVVYGSSKGGRRFADFGDWSQEQGVTGV